MPRLKKPISKKLNRDDDGSTFATPERRWKDACKFVNEVWPRVHEAHKKHEGQVWSYTDTERRTIIFMMKLMVTHTYGVAHLQREKRLALEARVAELEARPELRHCGIWKPNTRYRECNLTTHRGGLWLAKRANRSRPGESDAWALIVKSGHAQ